MRYAGDFVPPGMILSLSAANISNGKYLKQYRDEFVGTMLMIVCTFSAGKWWGADSLAIAWTTHALGVIVADYVGGGVSRHVAFFGWSSLFIWIYANSFIFPILLFLSTRFCLTKSSLTLTQP